MGLSVGLSVVASFVVDAFVDVAFDVVERVYFVFYVGVVCGGLKFFGIIVCVCGEFCVLLLLVLCDVC